MRDDEAWVDLSVLNSFEQRLHVMLNVGLAAFDREPLVHERAERNFIVKPAVNPWNRYSATLSALETARDCEEP